MTKQITPRKKVTLGLAITTLAVATIFSEYALAVDDLVNKADPTGLRNSPVGVWECMDPATRAPYFVTFDERTVRTTLPIATLSDSHALWEKTTGNGFRVTGRGLLYDSGVAVGIGRSDATGTLSPNNTLTASVTTSLKALDGTPLSQQTFNLECTRLSFTSVNR